MYQYKYFVANLDQQLMLKCNDLKILIEHIFPKFSLIFKTMEKYVGFKICCVFFIFVCTIRKIKLVKILTCIHIHMF